MVQKKVPNKLGIQADSLNKTEKRQPKHSLQNHDGKSKGAADLKTKKMKKSRPIKRSDLQQPLPKSREPPHKPEKPPPLLSPAKTPSPKKQPPSSPCKSSYASPNYMKSTSSSEARKEQTKVSVSTSSSSKLHRVAKTLSRSSTSLKKVRTLTKVPSFKHTRTGGNKCSKAVMQRATCSSTLKNTKFPAYFVLNPGATEAEGTSAMKVCPYNYCSLNGHHHTPAPPLKRFLSSRRRLLKTQKVDKKPEAVSPRKAKPVESTPVKPKEEPNDEFFVEIYVPAGSEDVKMEHDYGQAYSEGLSNEACSTNFQDDHDQNEDTISSEMNCNLEDTHDENDNNLSEYSDSGIANDQEVDNSVSVSLDEFFWEMSDMEWEEGQISATYLDNKSDVSGLGDDMSDQYEPNFKSHDDFSSYLKELLAEKLPPNCQDEITDRQHFSDTDSVPDDSESAQPGELQMEELVNAEEDNSIDSFHEKDLNLQVKSTDKQGIVFDPIDDIIEVENAELSFYQEPAETEDDEANEDRYTESEVGEESDADSLMEEGRLKDDGHKYAMEKNEGVEMFSAIEETFNADNSQVGIDQIEAGNEVDVGSDDEQKEDEANKLIIAGSTNSEEQNDSSIVKLHSHENCVPAVKSPEMEEINKTEELDASPIIKRKAGQTKNGVLTQRESDSSQEFLDSCYKLKRSMRCKKADDQSEEEKEFNPRGPNFLPVEPDPDAEKVDLRHQEMDERRNAEEWMLDFALQKTVNQLAPARKRKVALLVEAFEAVLPMPKCDPHLRRNSSGFAQARPIQACS